MDFVDLDLGVQPSPSAYDQLVIEGMGAMHVLFDAISTKKGRDGLYGDKGIAAVECVACTATKYGYPNDEGLPEHPLWLKGLSECQSSIVEVRGSPWLEEVMGQMTQSARRIWGDQYERIYKVPESGRKRPGARHFIFLFREHTFECIASDLVVTLYSGSWPTVSARVLAARSWEN
jgi:hypothetical protein